MGLGFGIAWSAASSIAVWPHGLCYVNELWGGTQNGYRLVSDGNYDWGQGVPELARWQQQHAISALDVLYFGTDPAIDLLPVRRLQFYDILALKTEEDVAAALAGKRLAVSMTLVHGAGLGDFAVIQYLRKRPPAARTQTFLIYDFSLP